MCLWKIFKLTEFYTETKYPVIALTKRDQFGNI